MTKINSTTLTTLQWRPTAISSETIGWISLCTTILASSTYNSFAKVLTDALSPLSLVFVSEILTMFFIFFSFGIFPTFRQFSTLTKKNLIALLLIGITSGTTAPILLFMGLHRTSAINATLFGNTEMLFLLLLAVFFLKEKIRRGHIWAMVGIGIGIMIIAMRGFTEGLTLHSGDLLIILACLVYSIGDLLFRKYLHHVKPHLVVLSRALVAVIGFMLISSLLTHSLASEIRSFPPSLFTALIGFALISRFINIFNFYEALDRLPVSTVSLFLNLTIVFSIIFAHWYLAEAVLPYQIIGGIFIILGTLCIELIGSHHPTSSHHRAHLKQRHAHRS